MPLKIAPMAEVCAQLDEQFPDLEYEADRDWLWVTSDLGPLHKGKCQCEECVTRSAIRQAIGRQGIGFSYAPNGHECPSGIMGFWAHRCEHPTRFKRRSKGRSEHEAADSGSETNPQPSETVSDAELLAIIGG